MQYAFLIALTACLLPPLSGRPRSAPLWPPNTDGGDDAPSQQTMDELLEERRIEGNGKAQPTMGRLLQDISQDNVEPTMDELLEEGRIEGNDKAQPTMGRLLQYITRGNAEPTIEDLLEEIRRLKGNVKAQQTIDLLLQDFRSAEVEDEERQTIDDLLQEIRSLDVKLKTRQRDNEAGDKALQTIGDLIQEIKHTELDEQKSSLEKLWDEQMEDIFGVDFDANVYDEVLRSALRILLQKQRHPFDLSLDKDKLERRDARTGKEWKSRDVDLRDILQHDLHRDLHADLQSDLQGDLHDLYREIQRDLQADIQSDPQSDKQSNLDRDLHRVLQADLQSDLRRDLQRDSDVLMGRNGEKGAIGLQDEQYDRRPEYIEDTAPKAYSYKNQYEQHKNQYEQHKNKYEQHKNQYEQHKNQYEQHKNQYEQHKNQFEQHKNQYEQHKNQYEQHKNQYEQRKNQFEPYKSQSGSSFKHSYDVIDDVPTNFPSVSKRINHPQLYFAALQKPSTFYSKSYSQTPRRNRKNRTRNFLKALHYLEQPPLSRVSGAALGNPAAVTSSSSSEVTSSTSGEPKREPESSHSARLSIALDLDVLSAMLSEQRDEQSQREKLQELYDKGRK